MPLQDHFHPPIAPTFPWESFHSLWAGSVVAFLNRTLPRRFRAFAQLHLGRHIEADVAEIDHGRGVEDDRGNGVSNGGVAVQAWAPPQTSLVIPAIFPDDIVVPVLDLEGGRILPVAVVEFVSPGNKDRAETRRAFALKSAAYLHRGLGLIVIDIVTGRRANLHNELMDLLGHPPTTRMPPETSIYATAYRPRQHEETSQIEVWRNPLAVNENLPVLPLALRGAMTVPVDLEGTYADACERSGL
jgi:hypothetical protein